MKRYLSIILSVLFIIVLSLGTISFAEVDSGKIDFFKAFSNNDVNVNRIGNSIHNWSIYLPNDAVVNKDSKSTMFDMTSSSYKINVSVNVLKNVHNFSLEELFVNSTTSNPSYNSYSSYYDSTYTCSSSIKHDKDNNRYISISSITPISPMYTFSDAADEQGTYNEQRIYLGNSSKSDYIYVVNINMDLPYYKLHQTLFSKIADSFETKFDTKSTNIKDLSEQVNTYRMFENKVYGWKIELAPYWKSQSVGTSTSQTFKPLYSDDEISGKSQATDKSIETESNSTDDSLDSANTDLTGNLDKSDSQLNKIKDSLNITVISSIPETQDFDKWADSEIKSIQTNYNNKLFTQISQPQAINTANMKEKQLVYEIKDSSTNSMITAVAFLQGNGYRYKLTFSMKKSKYNETLGKDTFDRMLKSFALVSTKSKYVSELLPADSVFNFNAARTIAIKKFNLKILADNNWLENSSIYDGALDDSYKYYDVTSNPYVSYDDNSNSETVTVNHSRSGTLLALTGESSTDTIDKTIKTILSNEFLKQDVSSGILDLKMNKSTVANNTIYKISENYNLEKMQKLSTDNDKKSFNYSNLYDTYTYVFKQGDDLYTIILSIPFMNASAENLKILESVWSKVVANQVEIGAKASQWQAVDLDKYKNAAQ